MKSNEEKRNWTGGRTLDSLKNADFESVLISRPSPFVRIREQGAGRFMTGSEIQVEIEFRQRMRRVLRGIESGEIVLTSR